MWWWREDGRLIKRRKKWANQGETEVGQSGEKEVGQSGEEASGPIRKRGKWANQKKKEVGQSGGIRKLVNRGRKKWANSRRSKWANRERINWANEEEKEVGQSGQHWCYTKEWGNGRGAILSGFGGMSIPPRPPHHPAGQLLWNE